MLIANWKARLGLLVFLGFGCTPDTLIEQRELDYQNDLAFLEARRPVSLHRDSLAFLIQRAETTLSQLAEYPHRNQINNDRIVALEKQYKSAIVKLDGLRHRPDQYNLAGWAKAILSQKNFPLEYRLHEIGNLLEPAATYYQHGMESLEDSISIANWDRAIRKNDRGLYFLGHELLDSLFSCTTIDQQERKRLEATIQNAKSATRMYLYFLHSQQVTQADRTIYHQ